MLPGEMLRTQDTEHCCHHPPPFLGCSGASLLSLTLGLIVSRELSPAVALGDILGKVRCI